MYNFIGYYVLDFKYTKKLKFVLKGVISALYSQLIRQLGNLRLTAPSIQLVFIEHFTKDSTHISKGHTKSSRIDHMLYPKISIK